MNRIALDLFLLIEKESTGIFFGTGWFEKTVGVSSGNFWPKKPAGGTSTGFSKNPPRFSGQIFRPIEFSLSQVIGSLLLTVVLKRAQRERSESKMVLPRRLGRRRVYSNQSA